MPTVETLMEIAKALKVPLGDLVVEIEEHRFSSFGRLQLENRLREAARSLTELDLLIAVGQLD